MYLSTGILCPFWLYLQKFEHSWLPFLQNYGGNHIIYLFFFFGCFNDVQPNDWNCFNLDKFKNWTKSSIFVYFLGVFKLVYRLAYVEILYIYIFNKAIHMRYMLLFRPMLMHMNQHPHICISLLFLFTEYMLW